MVGCRVCSQEDADHEALSFKNITRPKYAKPGDRFTISFDLKSETQYFDDRVSIKAIDNDTGECIYDGGHFILKLGTTVKQNITTVMPDKEYFNIRVSGWDINDWPFADDCEDTVDIQIKKGSVTSPPSTDISDPSTIDYMKYLPYILLILGLLAAYIFFRRK